MAAVGGTIPCVGKSWKYQLAIQFPIATVGDFDRMVEAEAKISEALNGIAEVTGHDAGSGEGNIFLHTDTPQVDLQTALQCLEEQVRDQVKSAYREVDGEVYSILWPSGLKEFRIL